MRRKSTNNLQHFTPKQTNSRPEAFKYGKSTQDIPTENGKKNKVDLRKKTGFSLSQVPCFFLACFIALYNYLLDKNEWSSAASNATTSIVTCAKACAHTTPTASNKSLQFLIKSLIYLSNNNTTYKYKLDKSTQNRTGMLKIVYLSSFLIGQADGMVPIKSNGPLGYVPLAKTSCSPPPAVRNAVLEGKWRPD